MAPGGEMFRYPQHFGENVLPCGSHEWLPYSKDEVHLMLPTIRIFQILSAVNRYAHSTVSTGMSNSSVSSSGSI